jgi:hypothetical protein
MDFMKNTKKRWKISAVFSMMAALLALQLAPFMTATASAYMRYYTNVSSNDFPDALKSNLASQPNWQKGFIDVTQAPYNAKGDNSTDDSAAIQAAINDGYDNNLVVYFPGNKTYVVSKQLVLNHINDEWVHPGSAWPSQRKFGHVLVGSTTGTPPVIRLQDGSMSAGEPLFLFQFFTPNGTAPQPPTPGLRHRDLATWYDPANATTDSTRQYVSTMRGIDINMGDNPDVDAISMDSAEHTALENIHIYGTFNTGLYRLPGSGGSVTNVTITGGKIGVFQDKFRPSPEITGLELVGQTQYGIQLMNARGALTVVGFKIQGPATPGPDYRAVYARNTEKDQIRGNFNLVDGTIEVAGAGNTAIYNFDQDAVMKNVYVKADTVIESGLKDGSADTLAGDKDIWKKVNEYAFASGSDTGYIHIDGAEYAHTGSDVVGVSDVVDEAPAEDMIAKHIWGTMPSWQTNIVDITAYGATRDNNSNDDAGAIQAAIDDTTDPANPTGNLGKTVFIPRGHFHIKSPITLKKGTKIIGAAENISVIEWDNSWLPTTPQVGLDTVDDADAGIILSDFALVANDPSASQGLENQKNITVLRIRGGNTTIRDVIIDRKENPQESYYKESTVVFSDNAEVKYTIYPRTIRPETPEMLR